MTALLAAGCGASTNARPRLDGVYRVSVRPADLAAVDEPTGNGADAGAWTLAFAGSRFALTRENERACTWAYGALRLAGDTLGLTVIDAGGFTPGAASQPGDRYAMRWSRYRDVLSLHPMRRASGAYLTAKPWRRIAAARSRNRLSRRCPPPATALIPTGAERVTPSPHAAFDFDGAAAALGPARWTGEGTAPRLGHGRLALAGHIPLRPRRARTRVAFALRFPHRVLSGCVIVEAVPRPHGRYLLDTTSGQVTTTSPGLRGYRGLPVTLQGVIRRGEGMQVRLYSEAPASRAPGDLC
jgi:hypothetical protein